MASKYRYRAWVYGAPHCTTQYFPTMRFPSVLSACYAVAARLPDLHKRTWLPAYRMRPFPIRFVLFILDVKYLLYVAQRSRIIAYSSKTPKRLKWNRAVRIFLHFILRRRGHTKATTESVVLLESESSGPEAIRGIFWRDWVRCPVWCYCRVIS